METLETRYIEGRERDNMESESNIKKLEKDLKTAEDLNFSNLKSLYQERETFENRLIKNREIDKRELEAKNEQLKEDLKTANVHNNDLHMMLNRLNHK